MALPLRLDSIEDLPDMLKDAYVEATGGGYELDFGQIKEHPAINKIRKTADDLDKKRRDGERALTALQEKYGDLDPETARAALAKLEDSDDRQMLDDGKLEELLEKRTERMRLDFDTKLSAKEKLLLDLEETLGTRDSELSDIKIYDAIKDAALKRGARRDALQDIKNRASGVWQLRDGKPAAYDGDDMVTGKRGEPLTIDEWVDTLASESDYLFEANTGGGAAGNDVTRVFDGVQSVSSDQSGDFIAQIASGEKVIGH